MFNLLNFSNYNNIYILFYNIIKIFYSYFYGKYLLYNSILYYICTRKRITNNHNYVLFH